MFWNVTKGSERFWKILKGFERFWKVLKGSERFQKGAKGSEMFQKILKGLQRFWKVTKGFRRFWKVTKVLKGLESSKRFIIYSSTMYLNSPNQRLLHKFKLKFPKCKKSTANSNWNSSNVKKCGKIQVPRIL